MLPSPAGPLLQELPPLYARWAGDLLTGPIPRETEATCDDCAMCVKDDGRLPTSVYFFDPAIKCCVYMPELANFLVGRILGDDDPSPSAEAGRETVRARVAAGIAVSPLGLGRPPSYDLVFRNSVNVSGRARSLRCPHYVEASGHCGIWRHREATCTTWFCRHGRGKLGSDFWTSLRELLVVVERALTRWCALRLGVDVEVLSRWIPREREPTLPRPPEGREVDGVADPATYAAIWAGWEGKEEAYFLACAERVEALSWADVMAIGGPDLEILAGLTRRAHDRLGSELVPLRLRVGGFQVAAGRVGGVRAVTYSHLDAIDLPEALLAILPLFDGRPTDEILRELAERGVGIDAGYLRQLCDWGVLRSD